MTVGDVPMILLGLLLVGYENLSSTPASSWIILLLCFIAGGVWFIVWKIEQIARHILDIGLLIKDTTDVRR